MYNRKRNNGYFILALLVLALFGAGYLWATIVGDPDGIVILQGDDPVGFVLVDTVELVQPGDPNWVELLHNYSTAPHRWEQVQQSK